MNEFLRELATLGLGIGALVLVGACAYFMQRDLRKRFARRSQRRTLMLLLTLLGIACFALVAWSLPLIDSPRRPLLDYVGILLALAAFGTFASLARDLLAGLQLRLRGAPRNAVWIRAGAIVGQVSHRGLLQVVLTTVNGDFVHLPNRYLLQVPVRILTEGRQAGELADLAVAERAAVASPVQSQLAEYEPPAAAGNRPGPQTMAVADRREPVLTTGIEPAGEVPVPVTPVDTAEPLIKAVAEPAPDPKKLAELQQLKNEYTELSQQLLQTERELQDASQGPDRQSLSLEKKKLEARLLRLDKQIGQLQGDERRRA